MPKKHDHLSRPLETIEVTDKTVNQLITAMGKTGFQGKSLARCVDVWEQMIAQPDNIIFLGLAGSMSTAGQWKLVRWLVENRFVDVVVSTGANVSEDIFEAMGNKYYQGSHIVDDEELLGHRIDRYYDVYADELEYRNLESMIQDFMRNLPTDHEYSSADFLREFGLWQDAKGINSITAAAARAGVPVFSPALADSGYGVAAYQLFKETGATPILGQFRDFHQLGEIGERAGSTSPVYIGGGVPKDTIQLVTVMVDLARGNGVPYPHALAVQVTTDSPQWGGLSGCTFEEAVSWGKIDPEGEQAVCYADATLALPLIVHALAERGLKRDNPPDFSWMHQ